MTNTHTPLAHIGNVAPNINAGVVMVEDKLRGHLILRGNADNVEFTTVVEKVLGVALPTQALTSNVVGDTRIGWLGPNEWLLLLPAGMQNQVEIALREALANQHVAVTDVSSAQTLVNLSGGHVEEVMMKSTVYDCGKDNLSVGKFVQTTFAKTGATLYRREDGSIDLIIRRSFADYFFLWLSDACEEYGLQVVS